MGRSIRRHFRMLAGCILPWLLIFMLPLLGISEATSVFVAIVLIFACHLLMMRRLSMAGEHAAHHSTKGEHDGHS